MKKDYAPCTLTQGKLALGYHRQVHSLVDGWRSVSDALHAKIEVCVCSANEK